MDRTLFSDEHRLFRDSFRTFLAREVVPHQERWREAGIVDREAFRKAGQAGFLCPWVAEEYGGAGADFLFSVVVSEELSRIYESGFAMPLHSDIVVPYLASFGSEEQRRRWLPGCVSGEIVTALAMTEPGTGSDVAAIATTARREGDEYVIDGAKTFISNGQLCDLVVVAARTDPEPGRSHRGVSLIVVEAGAGGFVRGKRLKKMGMASQDTSELFFEGCRVPLANRLGEEGAGFGFLMQKLQQERLIVAVGAQASAEQVLADTVAYTQERKAFGKSIASFQNTQFKLVDCATEVEVGRAFLDRLIEEHARGASLVKECSMAKLWQTEMASRVVDTCLQFFGGYGYMLEYPVARAYMDARVQKIYAGTNEIMKLIIARQMGLLDRLAGALTAPRSPRAALAYPDFRLFQGARVCSVMAQQVQLVAVGFHVYSVTHRARDLGYVGLAQFLPAIGFSMVTGLVADRFDRLRIVRVCYGVLALCSTALAGLSWGEAPRIGAIYAVLFVVGTARAFGGPAQSALITHLVPREDFPSAVAIGTFLWQMATILGPALGGAVLALLGRASFVYSLCAGLLVAGSVCLGRMRVRTGRMEARATSLSTLVAGVRYVFAQKLLLGAISLDLFAVLLGGAVALMPAIARDILHTGAFGLGLLRAAPALGASLMASVLAYRPLARHEGAWMLGGVLLFGLGTVGFGLSRNMGLSLAFLFVIGASDMVSVVIRQTLIQMSTPTEMRGRVGAVTQVFVGASNELGEFESGLTADWFGTVSAVVIGGVGTCAVVLLWALGFRQLRAVDRLAEIAPPPG